MAAGAFLFDPAVVRAAAAAMSVVFLLGALAKLRDMTVFRYAVENYRLLPAALVAPFAWAFALAELAAGAALVLAPAQPLAPFSAASVLAVATGAVAVSLLRGLDRIECGCGGSGQRISWGLVARNAGLAIVVAVAAGPETGRTLGAFDYFTVAGLVLALLALHACANQLLANQPFLKEIHP